MCHKGARGGGGRCRLNVGVNKEGVCCITDRAGVEVAWHRFLKDPCHQSDCSQTFMAHIQPFRPFGKGAPSSIPSPTSTSQIYDWSRLRQEAAQRESSSLILSPSSLIFICIFINDADYGVITASLLLA